jgi:hypothetical protein
MGQAQTAQKDFDLFAQLPRGSCVIFDNGLIGTTTHAIKADNNRILVQNAKGVVVERDVEMYLGRKGSIDRFATQRRQEVCESSKSSSKHTTLEEYYLACLEAAQGLVGRRLKNRQEFPLVCYGLTDSEKSDDVFRLAGF